MADGAQGEAKDADGAAVDIGLSCQVVDRREQVILLAEAHRDLVTFAFATMAVVEHEDGVAGMMQEVRVRQQLRTAAPVTVRKHDPGRRRAAHWDVPTGEPGAIAAEDRHVLSREIEIGQRVIFLFVRWMKDALGDEPGDDEQHAGERREHGNERPERAVHART